jgi:hypothetical protein
MSKMKADDMVHDQVGGSQEPNMEKKDQLAQKPDDVYIATNVPEKVCGDSKCKGLIVRLFWMRT